MAQADILAQLGLVVVAATGALVLARMVDLPPLLAYIVAGLALGPASGLLSPHAHGSLELFSELGVALLLFLVGMELSVARVREVGRTAVLTGLGQMAATLAAGAALALVFGFSPVESLFLGLALTFSSTVVVVKLLERVGGLAEPWGRIAVGVLLVQDVAVAVALTVVAGLGGGEADAAALGPRLLGSLVGLLALVAAAAAAVRFGLGRLFDWLSDSPEAALTVSLGWCLLFILGAEVAHLSVELGAFVAGVALAQLPGCAPVRRRLHPLVDLFLAVFFVSLGAGMDPGAALKHWETVLALTLAAVVLKPLLVGGLLGRLGQSRRTAVLSGLTLGQISEFAFVLLGGAAAAGLVGDEVLSVVGAVGLASIGASALLVPRGEQLYGRLRHLPLAGLFGEDRQEPAGRVHRRDHVVVVGMNLLGHSLVRGLAGRGETVVAVDTDAAKLEGLPGERVVGDINEARVLEEADLADARLAVSALQIEGTNRLFVHRCREAGVPVAVHAFEAVQVDELTELGADHLMVTKHVAAREMAARLRELGVVS